MIGRGIFQDPYVFSRNSLWKQMETEEKIGLYKRHIELFEQEWGGKKNPAGLKKFAKVYISGVDGASELRGRLMKCNNSDKILKELDNV